MKLVTTEAVLTALCQHCDSHIEMCGECGMREIIESVPSAWIKCSERLPEDGKTVMCAIYHTDLVVAHEGETIEEAVARCQAEAAKHPYMMMGCYYEGEGWSEDVFGAPMVCAPSYWLEIPPMPPLPDAPEVEG